MKASDDILVLALTAEAAAHVCLALQQHSKWAHRAGLAVPAELPEIERVLATRAGRGQQATPMADLPETRHDQTMTPRLLDYAAVATVLGVSERTVKRLVAAGDLPVVRVLGASRVRAEDVDGYIARLTAESTSPKDVQSC